VTQQETISLEYRKKWLGELRKMMFKYIDKDKYAVFLYGSAVNSLLRAHDFDIGVLGEERLPDSIMNMIIDEIEESKIPMKIDIVDFKRVDYEFRNIAMEEIQIWNKPEYIRLN